MIIKITVCTLISFMCFICGQTNACTGTTLKAIDGSVVYGRTLEFGFDIKSNVLVIPRGYKFKGNSKYPNVGLEWKSKYAVVGANGEGAPIIVDGVNEKGLAVGSFYFPGFAKY